MKLSVNAEKDGIRIELELQTKEMISDKVLNKSESLQDYIKELLRNSGSVIINAIQHELQVLYPDGIR